MNGKIAFMLLDTQRFIVNYYWTHANTYDYLRQLRFWIRILTHFGEVGVTP